MDIHNHNLNIHYSIPENLWNELVEMFAQLPHYRGLVMAVRNGMDVTES